WRDPVAGPPARGAVRLRDVGGGRQRPGGAQGLPAGGARAGDGRGGVESCGGHRGGAGLPGDDEDGPGAGGAGAGRTPRAGRGGGRGGGGGELLKGWAAGGWVEWMLGVRRGPKKPRPRRSKGERYHHFATKKLLDAAKGERPPQAI